MVLAWSFLFPIGILVARFMKVTPGQDWPRVVDNKAWWHTHLSTQYCGGVAVVLALWLVYQVTGFRSTVELHRYFGWITVGLCALQFVAGWLRGTKGG
ncbi:MAG: cytochrome B, partial [Pseudomonadota bacterium]